MCVSHRKIEKSSSKEQRQTKKGGEQMSQKIRNGLQTGSTIRVDLDKFIAGSEKQLVIFIADKKNGNGNGNGLPAFERGK